MSNKGSYNGVPLMPEEEVEMSFGERHGLKMETVIDRNTMVLTDRRLIRLARAGSSWETVFLSLEDAQVVKVRVTSRSKRPLLRAALLLAGAGAALAAIDFFPLSLVLAAVLGLGGGYHLLRYLTISHQGSILFHTASTDVEMPFVGNMADQAYTFVNRFSQLKAASSSPAGADQVDQKDGIEADVPPRQEGLGADETGTGAMTDMGGESPSDTHQEALPQEEQAKSRDEEPGPMQPSQQTSGRLQETPPA
ncbi:MAG: hypothetical protein HY672_00120 [Chloroflexi bacterium]|nr:hypothetical protein [Chloroflexota bacterium]